MKKLLSALLCLVLCLCFLASCGSRVTRAGVSFTVPSTMTLDEEDEIYPEIFTLQQNDHIGYAYMAFEVVKDEREAKGWLDPYERVYGGDCTPVENRKIGELTWNGIYSEDLKKTYLYAAIGEKYITLYLSNLSLNDADVTKVLESLKPAN